MAVVGAWTTFIVASAGASDDAIRSCGVERGCDRRVCLPAADLPSHPGALLGRPERARLRPVARFLALDDRPRGHDQVARVHRPRRAADRFDRHHRLLLQALSGPGLPVARGTNFDLRACAGAADARPRSSARAFAALLVLFRPSSSPPAAAADPRDRGLASSGHFDSVPAVRELHATGELTSTPSTRLVSLAR